MDNIFTASKSFLSFSKLFGLFPYSFEEPSRKGIFKVRVSGVLLTLCSFSILVYLTWSNLSFMVLVTNESKLLVYAWNIAKNLETFSLFCMFGYQLFKRKNVIRFLKIINEVDKDVKTNHSKISKSFNCFYILASKNVHHDRMQET